MVEFQRNPDREPSASPLKICVVGVGGGGLNVLDRICLDRLMEVTLVSMHTDVRVLGHAMAPLKIQLGSDMMRGIGCGGDPELGREAAESSSGQIRAAMQGHDMVFICTGLGGGTGSGAAPVAAQIARDLGAMVFIFATMPFSFEGRRRLTQAEMALEELQRSADAVILFENNRMGELVLPKEGIQKAFSQADQLIGHSVRAISTMVTQPGVVRMGLADLMTALRSPNARCLFGFGEARGNNRVQDALKRALKSPLVNQGQLLQNARNLLVHIAGGDNLTLAEVESLMKQLGKHVPESTQIMFGLAVDPKLGDMMTVTLISSLTAQEMALEPSGAAALAAPVQRVAVQPAPPVPPTRAAAPAPAAAPKSEPSTGELFTAFLESPAPLAPAAPAPAPVTAPVIPAASAPPTSAPAPVPAQEMPAPKAAPEPPAPPAPVAVAAPEPVVEEAPAPVAAAPEPPPMPEVEPVKAETPAEETTESVSTAPIKAASIHVQAPAKPSVFAMVEDEDEEDEDDEEEYEEEEEDGDVVDEQEEGSDEEEAAGAHWADKYIQPKPHAGATPVVEPRREPQRTLQTTASAPVKKTVEARQPALKLDQEEVTRFKGTDKTIVDGDDLDIPTWMRLRGKVKR